MSDPQLAPTTSWERFIAMTVWSDENTDPFDENRTGPQIWFPLFDLMAMLLGITALWVGSPILNRLFEPTLVDAGGIALLVVGAACGVGVIFPKLALIELFGKLGIIFMLSAYSGTIAVLGRSDSSNLFVVLSLFMIPVLLMPRVCGLSIRLVRMYLAKKAVRERASTSIEGAE